MNDQKYLSDAKYEWRNWVYSSLTADTTYSIVDEDNNFQGRWMELIGVDAISFGQLLSTGRIKEEQLIGINTDQSIIDSARLLYPGAEYYCGTWESYCEKNKAKDVMVYNMDSTYAGYGEKFEYILKCTLKSILRNSSKIDEVVLIMNFDASKTDRGKAYHIGMSVEDVICAGINHQLLKCYNSDRSGNISPVQIISDKFYRYRQSKKNTEMISCIVKL